MALERYLLRSSGTFTHRGTLVFAQVRPRSPERCGHPLAKARSEGLRVTRPAGGNVPKRCRSQLGWVTQPIDVQRACVHFSCVFSYSERTSIVNGGGDGRLRARADRWV